MIIDKEKFKLIRARKCMSRSDLLSSGVSQGNLNSIWNRRSVRPETAGKIARALGVDVLDIIEQEV